MIIFADNLAYFSKKKKKKLNLIPKFKISETNIHFKSFNNLIGLAK